MADNCADFFHSQKTGRWVLGFTLHSPFNSVWEPSPGKGTAYIKWIFCLLAPWLTPRELSIPWSKNLVMRSLTLTFTLPIRLAYFPLHSSTGHFPHLTIYWGNRNDLVSFLKAVLGYVCFSVAWHTVILLRACHMWLRWDWNPDPMYPLLYLYFSSLSRSPLLLVQYSHGCSISHSHDAC